MIYKSSISIAKIINDPSIIVRTDEDLTIRNHIPGLVIRALNRTLAEMRVKVLDSKAPLSNLSSFQINQIAAEKLKICERSIYRYKKQHLIAYDKTKDRFVSLVNFNGPISEIDQRFMAISHIIREAKKRIKKNTKNE